MNNQIKIILLLFILSTGCSPLTNKIPVAENGILNLSDWHFESDGTIKLDGEWEFYWKNILNPADFKKDVKTNFEYVKFPGLWNSIDNDSLVITYDGYATYRLKVVINHESKNQIYALKYTHQQTAYNIYVEDNKLVEIGKVGEFKSTSIPNSNGGISFFFIDNDTIQIIVNVSNFHHRKGGISSSLELGTQNQILTKFKTIRYLDFFLAGILLIMIFYHFSIYILRKKEKTPIIFSFFCFIVFIRLITTGERILLDIFPLIPYEISVRIEYLSFFFSIPATLHFLNTFFPVEFNKQILRISYLVSISFTLFTLFTPPLIFSYTINPYQIIFLISIVYTIVSLVLCIIRKRKFSILIFAGIFILIIAALNDIARTHNMLNTIFLSAYGFAVMIFLQSYVLSKKFTDAYKEIEDLSENLEFKVYQRTVEIAHKNDLLEVKNQEIADQKETLEIAFKNIKLIGEIGRHITVNLSIHDILQSIYHNLNNLLDAQIVAFGILDDNFEKLYFYGIENGDYKVLTGADELIDENQLSVWCFKNQKNILINDYEHEYENYISNKYNFAKIRSSLIYVPITFKDKKIGVFTVQSFSQNAYNQNHLNIINNISIYAAIAIENANSFKLLEKQKKQLEKSSEQIHSSLVYASRIQSAILPALDIENHLFLKNFILFKPRDLVSGDFYWFKNFGRVSVIAAADCTGHGVPGSIMSMLGISVLNEIVNRRNLTMPGQILNELRASIKNSLKQNGERGQSQDGMDIAFCSINIETKTLYYAGANNPLWLFRNDELIEFKPDRQPVGIFFNEKPFNDYTIQLQEKDVFYIFSDGFHSQFGGNGLIKYKSKRFKEFLFENYRKPMDQQKSILENEFDTWKGEHQQTDDVLVIGLKLE
jgi:serine phosphatase RsbU (regulator of sigma subunit)